MMQFFLVLALLCNLIWPALSSAGTYNDLTESQKDYWYKLIHAEYFSGKSQLDGEKFFLSPHGKESPSLELGATIEAFKDPKKTAGWFNYPAQCVFRARYQFLKEIGFLKDVQEVSCPMFDEWKKGLNAESATLVFSSSYPNNPSSLFGHTLIRLNQKNKKNDLLDYAVSFSALPEQTDIGILFAIKGLFGGYKGFIEISKYYVKVGDYNNSESRDLLEYDLKFSPKQLDRFIEHVWEIYQTTYAYYYFIDKNCSSFLADLMAVAVGGETNINSRSRWYYLPSEIVRSAYRENLISEFNFRPSLKKQLKEKINTLNEKELIELKTIIKNQQKDFGETSLFVLDSAIDYFEYKKYSNKELLNDADSTTFRKLLLAVSKRSRPEIQDKKMQSNNRPELGHDSKYAHLFYQNENSRSQLIVNYKNGYHSLADRDQGFDPFSEFDFFSGGIIYDRSLNRLTINELSFANLISLHPYTFYDPQFSWDVGLNYGRIYLSSCDLCHKIGAHGRVGYSFELNRSRLNFLTGLFTELSSHYQNKYKLGPSVLVSYLFNFEDKFKLNAMLEEKYGVINHLENNFQTIWSIKGNYYLNRNDDLNFEYKQLSQYNSLKKDTRIISVGYGKHF